MNVIELRRKYRVVILVGLLGLALTGCDHSTKLEPPQPTTSANDSSDSLTLTVDGLAADPERLKALQQRCKQNPDEVGAVTCKLVSEAWRKRFMGDGKARYTPTVYRLSVEDASKDTYSSARAT